MSRNRRSFQTSLKTVNAGSGGSGIKSPGTRKALSAGSLSASYAPKSGTDGFHDYVGELKALFYKYSVKGRLNLTYETRSFMGEV
jgi:hypothetical protein